MRSLSFGGRKPFGGLGAALLAVGVCLSLPTAAQARGEIAPYLELEQVFEADLNGGGDVLTYTTVAAGVDAGVTTRRVQAQISYRYERHIAWGDGEVDQDVHSGLAAARVQVVPDMLSVDAGALAARARQDPRGPFSGFSNAEDANTAEVYAAFAGPTLSTHAGPVAINAAYRLGYVTVDDESLAGGIFPGEPLGEFDSSTSHTVTASVGMAPGTLPVGWTVSAGYQREDTDHLDQKWEGKFVRGDVVVPVSGTLAVTGGVGYEKLEASQQDILRTPGGVPVISPDGELVPDSSKPRVLTYDESGVIWDAGVIWRPNPRTELQARVGERYGGTTVVGTLQYQISKAFAFSAVVYDSVTSFGRLVVSDISGLPTRFKIDHVGLRRGVGGCVFGSEPGTGGCLDNALQSVTTANFRNRGVGLLLSGSRGPWDLEVGFGYARRKYIAPDFGTFSFDGVVDESATLEGSISRALTARSGIEFDAYAAWYNTGFTGNDSSFGTGLTATYYRSLLLDRLQGEASLGIYHSESGDFDSTIAAALLGLRYDF